MSWLVDADVLSQPAKSHGEMLQAWLTRLTEALHFRRPGLSVFNPFKELG